MSTATADAAEAAPKGGAGKKKLIIVVAVVLLLVLGGGGAALMLMKKKSADAEGEDGDGHAPAAAAPAHAKKDIKHDAPPVFVPLDPFTVNLADKDAERYAQVGITLQVEDAKTGDTIKGYMPAIRNNILLLLSHKNAAELLTREGKIKLAREIQRESLAPLGYEMELPDDEAADSEDEKPTKKKKKKKVVEQVYPITAVHFSNIIIQ